MFCAGNDSSVVRGRQEVSVTSEFATIRMRCLANFHDRVRTQQRSPKRSISIRFPLTLPINKYFCRQSRNQFLIGLIIYIQAFYRSQQHRSTWLTQAPLTTVCSSFWPQQLRQRQPLLRPRQCQQWHPCSNRHELLSTAPHHASRSIHHWLSPG